MQTLVLIGNGTALSGTPTSPAEVQDGVVAVFGANGFIANAGAATVANHPWIQIAQGVADGETPRVSQKIRPEDVASWTGKVYTAPKGAEYRIGYHANNTAGNIAYTVGAAYALMEETISDFETDQRLNVEVIAEKSIAHTLQQYCKLHNVKKGKASIVKMFTDGGETAIGGSATLSVYKDSPLVIASNASHNLVADDLVRIGGSGNTYETFQVKSVSGAEITLKSPWTGASATGVAAYELDTVTKYGLEFSATDISQNYSINTYDYSEFDGEDILENQTYTRGNGTGKQVKEHYLQSLSSSGMVINQWNRPVPFVNHADENETYDQYQLYLKTRSINEASGGVTYNSTTITIYYKAGDTDNNYLEDVLNAWLGDAANVAAVNF